MRAALFITIVLLSGCLAGTIHGLVNLTIVEPYLDKAIGIENQKLFASGKEKNTPDFWIQYDSYRYWQKSGEILAGTILGTSIGALFGIVFAYSRNALPGSTNVKKGLILAGIMWLILYVIPFLKYPANPPTVGNPETIVLREVLYLSFIAISGFGAVGFYQLYKRLQKNKKYVAFIGYAVLMSITFVVMPANPDAINAPMDLVNVFRAMSFIAVSIFWISVGFILGAFWQKFSPEKFVQSKIN